MRRTQLYLDDDLWSTLHAKAHREGTTISDLMRQAARQCYLGSLSQRSAAMEAFIGIRKGREQLDSTDYVRGLRRGSRIEKLSAQSTPKS